METKASRILFLSALLATCLLYSCNTAKKTAKINKTQPKDTIEISVANDTLPKPIKETEIKESPAEIEKTTIKEKPEIPLEMELVNIPEGTIVVNNKIENPYYKPKTISTKGFKISKTEITNFQYCQFLNNLGIDSLGILNGTKLFNIEDPFLQIEYVSNNWQAKHKYENYPMICVTWYGADEYCKWAGGCLPSQEEWEYAASGGDNNNYIHLFSGSDNISEVAWYANNSNLETHKVGQKKANEFGLFDMSGNVAEWTSDWFIPQDNNSKYLNKYKIIKGGSWASSNALYCQIWYQDLNFPNNCNFTTGFRLLKRDK